MNELRELLARRERLLARCAAEREGAADSAATIAAGLAGVDRGLARLQRWPLKPLALIAVTLGVATLAGRGRLRSLRAPGTALGLLAAGLRARSLAGRLRASLPEPAADD